MEIDRRINSSKYGDGIKLQDYNGTFSVIATRHNEEGKIYMQWAFPQKDRKPVEKAIPFKVSLGTKEEAIEILESFVAGLKGDAVSAETQEAVDTVQEVVNEEDETVPF